MKIFEKYGMSKTIQFFVGCLILVLMIVLGACLFPETAADQPSLMFRMFIGLAIGYGLSRAAMGFAGTVNRAYTTGSTKLMKAIAILFLMGAVATFIIVVSDAHNVLIKKDELGKPVLDELGNVVLIPHLIRASLPGNTLNAGLFIGATLFGFGMSFGVCCASGVLTDMADSPLRAGVVLLFFCLGGFLGKALVIQPWMAWAKKPWFGITKDQLNFTTWFKWDGANGAIGAIILTTLLVALVIFLANLYEKKRKANETYTGVECEKCYEAECAMNKEEQTLAYRLIAKPWGMLAGSLVIAICFGALLLSTGGGWGVSGPLGQWFARLLNMLGVSKEALMNFTGYGDSVFTAGFFTNAMYVQDFSIFAGAIIYLLMAGKFWKPKAWLFKPLEIVFFALGGILLGIAINLAGGCNAGGLFTPIASFATSGWIYLICLVVGGTLGNIVRKYLYKVTKLSE